MKKATNITPIEIWEEGLYTLVQHVCLSASVSLVILAVHLFIYHALISWGAIIGAFALFGGYIFIMGWKSRRFGRKNLTIAERVCELEGAIGVTVA